MRKQIKMAMLASYISVCSYPHIAYAETETETETKTRAEDNLLFEEIIVRSSPYNSQQSDLISTVNLINEDDIHHKISTNIGQLIEHLPGVDQASYGAAVGRPVIRGLGGYRIAVLENGLMQGDISSTAGDHANALSLVDFERVELLKGASALRYGSYANTGVVNMYNRHLLQDMPSGGFVTTGYGDAAERMHGGFFARQNTGRLSISASAFHLDKDNMEIPSGAESFYQLQEEGETAEGGAQELDNSWVDQESYSLAGQFGDDNLRLTLMTNLQDTSYGVIGHTHEEHHDDDHGEDEEGAVKIKFEKETLRARLNGQLNGRLESFLFDVTMIDYDHQELEGAEIGTAFNQKMVETKLELGDLNTNGLGLFGASWRDVDLSSRGAEAYLPSTNTEVLSLYHLWRGEWQNWIAETGLRLDQQEVNNAAHSRSDDMVSVSFGLGYKPSDNALFGISLASNERAPAPTELYADGVHAAARRHETGDRSLDKETSTTSEFYYRQKIDNLSLSLSAYRIDYQDFIYLERLPTQHEGLDSYAYRQQDAELEGFEISLKHQAKWQGAKLVNQLGFSHLNGTRDDGAPMRAIPAHKLVWDTHLDWTSVSLNMRVHLVEDQDRLAPRELKTDGYEKLDISVDWTPPQANGLTVSFAAENLTDEEIRHHSSDLKDLAPQAGRDLSMTLLYAF